LSQQLAKTKYRHPDLTKRDVLAALQHYRGLQPKQERFIFNDGNQRELVNLDGTIPVPYKGQTYNIPMILWLLDTHPYHAPMCYIKPTHDMQIKVSKHVDHTGKIYLPYLHEWKHPNSDLLGLIQICIIIFSEQPPVYAKPQEPTPAPQNLPYPVQTGYGYPPMSMPGQSQYPRSPGYPPAGPQPGYPPYPPAGPGYPPGPTNPPAYPPSTSSGGYPGYPPATSNTPYPPAAGQGGLPPYSSQASTVSTASGNINTGTGTVTQEHLRMSILSAVEDKVRKRVREEFSARQAETESIRQTSEELTQGRTRLTAMIEKLTQETEELDQNIKILATKQDEMNDLAEKMETRGEMDVDEAVVPTAPLYKQLITAFAEEAATEDAIYYLAQAQRRGVIDCETFLKQVRNLSRKQFRLRATMQKCRKTAGLKA